MTYYLIFINLIAFITMGLDKYFAIKDMYRIREKNLLFLAIIGGATGSYLAMKYFRHKTKHKTFKYGVPIMIVINYYLIYLINELKYLF